MQVAEGEGDWAPASIGMQWGTTMNASTVLVLVERHKLEQDAATGMQFALGQNTVHIVPNCIPIDAGVWFLSPSATCTGGVLPLIN